MWPACVCSSMCGLGNKEPRQSSSVAPSLSVVRCDGRHTESLFTKAARLPPEKNQPSVPEGPQRTNLLSQQLCSNTAFAPRARDLRGRAGPEPGPAGAKRRHHVLPGLSGVVATAFCLGLPDTEPMSGASCKRDCSPGKLETKSRSHLGLHCLPRVAPGSLGCWLLGVGSHYPRLWGPERGLFPAPSPRHR